MEFFRRVLAQITNFWRALNSGQKAGIIASLLLIIFGVIVVIILAARPNFQPLFSNLNSEDAAAIVEKLKEANIPFKLENAGSLILVPKENVYETRLQLASQGLPQGGGIGFEIFDRTSYNVTEFTQRVNYLRALQTELARTIRKLSPVEDANVHLVIPEPQLWEDKEKEATASVVLKLRPGTTLDEGQIKGVIHLVSRSVEGLKPENIEVLDTKGNILSDLLQNDQFNGKVSVEQFNAQRTFEKNLEKRMLGMLEQVLGPGNIVVRATAELDFSKKETQSETYQPVVGKKGIVRSEQNTEESFKGRGVKPGGVPGVTSNVPGYPGVVQGASEYEKTQNTKNYEISKVEQKTIEAPGTIKRLSIALIVDSNVLRKRKINDIKKVAVAAGGINYNRGDVVEVVNMPFSTEVQDKENAQIRKEYLRKRNFIIISLLLSILFLVFAFLALRPQKPKIEEFTPQEAITVEKLHEEIAESALPDVMGIKAETGEISEELSKEKKHKLQIAEEINELVASRPADLAQIVKSWMEEE